MCSHHRINQMAFERQDTCLVNLMVELFDCMEVVFLNWYWKWQAITAWHFTWITYQLGSSYMESYYKILKIYCCIRSAFKIYWISFFTTRQAVTHLGEKKEQFKKLYDVFAWVDVGSDEAQKSRKYCRYWRFKWSTKQVCIPVGCVPPACCPYLPPCTAPRCEQNSWHTLLKILPCPNFVAGCNNGDSFSLYVTINVFSQWKLKKKDLLYRRNSFCQFITQLMNKTLSLGILRTIWTAKEAFSH